MDASDHDRLIVVEERQRAETEERKRQAVEYERRLGELNHAHEKNIERNAEFVSRDKFDGHANATNAKLAVLEGRDTGGKPLRDIGMLIVGAAIAAGLAVLTR